RLDVEALATLLAPVYDDAGLSPTTDLSQDLEIVTRQGATHRYVVAINHTDQPADVPVPGTDLLTGESSTASFTVAAGAVRVVRAV
ncbi:MAG TPA: Beta-galactosidase C-terminal domain, partial [Cellulomonadaceae bacterium]|nr:Beta-galactosidase C-terminal domain [Cellulomonadaceae bacterium]